MKPFLCATRQFFRQIWADAMLSVLLFVPPVMGLAFRFGVPALEGFLCASTGNVAVLAPHYPLFDLLLAAMTPVMFSTAGALVVLDEADSGISRIYATSPVGKLGYLMSRIVVPTALAMLYCVIVLLLFRLSELELDRVLLLALCSGALGLAAALLIPSIAKNRVEGMAASKLSGLIMLGIPAALLLPAPIRYAAGILPSFWMTELVMGGSLLYAIPALLTALLLVWLLARRFSRRIL